MPKMLSKSRVLAARQCPKRLWLEANRPELLIVTPDVQRRFDRRPQPVHSHDGSALSTSPAPRSAATNCARATPLSGTKRSCCPFSCATALTAPYAMRLCAASRLQRHAGTPSARWE